MPKSALPKPSGPLPGPPKRPWGTGSIEVRGRGYMARWRENGQSKQKLCRTIEEAEQHLQEVYPAYRAVSRAELRVLIANWLAAADWMDHEPQRGALEEEDEGARVARLVRQAHAQALAACASSLEDLLSG